MKQLPTTNKIISSQKASCNGRHSLLPWDLACARFRCAHLPLIGPTITLNLPSWKAVGLHWRFVGARSQVVECLSSLSVLCGSAIALSDCVLSCYSRG